MFDIPVSVLWALIALLCLWSIRQGHLNKRLTTRLIQPSHEEREEIGSLPAVSLPNATSIFIEAEGDPWVSLSPVNHISRIVLNQRLSDGRGVAIEPTVGKDTHTIWQVFKVQIGTSDRYKMRRTRVAEIGPGYRKVLNPLYGRLVELDEMLWEGNDG